MAAVIVSLILIAASTVSAIFVPFIIIFEDSNGDAYFYDFDRNPYFYDFDRMCRLNKSSKIILKLFQILLFYPYYFIHFFIILTKKYFYKIFEIKFR